MKSRRLLLNFPRHPEDRDAFKEDNMKQIIYVFSFILLLTSTIDAQITGNTNTGRLIPKKIPPPEINITYPDISITKDIIHEENFIEVHGSVTSKIEIKEVSINGASITLQEESKFSSNVYLNYGVNNILVKATDSQNQSSELQFTVIALLDVTGPIISVIEPAVTRGFKVISKEEMITIRGRAIDDSGILDVTVNDRKANLSPEGDFNIDMQLRLGDNELIIEATDKKYNSTKDTVSVTRQPKDLFIHGKFIALVIGINEYKGTWAQLKNAVRDAEAVSDLLTNQYGFDKIYTLYDGEATRENIIQKFESLTREVEENDNVIIYYSGHGEFKQYLNKGYWVPVDAATQSVAGFISNSDIQTFLNGIRSKHTLLVSDACFAGDIFRGRTEILEFESSERYFQEVYRRASRSALTSGGIEPVADIGREGHSVFTYYLLKALTENTNRYFTAGQLFNEIKIPVSNNSEQTPIYQPIKNTGDEGGEFVFVRK